MRRLAVVVCSLRSLRSFVRLFDRLRSTVGCRRRRRRRRCCCCWLLVVVCCWFVGCWLLVVGCWLLFVVCCWLSVLGCRLLVRRPSVRPSVCLSVRRFVRPWVVSCCRCLCVSWTFVHWLVGSAAVIVDCRWGLGLRWVFLCVLCGVITASLADWNVQRRVWLRRRSSTPGGWSLSLVWRGGT